MGRSAHVPGGSIPDHCRMHDCGLHYIEDDLSETWLQDWAGVGVSELEALLAKHAAFLGYLEQIESE
jgi:hypothetical protein